jgi:membrane-anchored protein YejM (alkaline phosphatase superfamily)
MITDENAGDIFQFSMTLKTLAFTFVLSLLVGKVLIGRFIWTKKLFRYIKHPKYIITLTLISLFITNVFNAVSAAQAYVPVLKVAKNYPLFQPLTANTLLGKLNLVNTVALEANKIPDNLKNSGTLKYPLAEIVTKDAIKQNVLLITIDCWRGDCMDSIITPNIYRFAKKNIIFTDHHSGSNGTRGSIFSMFYGLPSFSYWNEMKLNRTRPVMMQTMDDLGYDFGIFGSAVLTMPAFHQTAFAGIDNLRLKTESKNRVPYARDEKITTEWLDYIDKYQKKDTSAPFMGFLFYDAAHGCSHPDPLKAPFQPSWETVNYLKLSNEFNPEPYFNLFKNTIHYMDSLIGKVLDDLENRNLLDNTIVLITGDHGEEFNDNKKNFWGHGGNFSKTQLHIPLVIHWPEREPNIYSHRTYHYDIAPTLMTDMLGCQNKISDYANGKLLWQKESKNYFMAGADLNYAIIEPDKITTVLYGNYEITTPGMQPLDNSMLNSPIILRAMKEANRFLCTE